MRIFAPAILAAPLLVLTGCGLSPLYSGGSRGAVATTLGGVEVAPIEGRAGYLMRGALAQRLPQATAARPYRLEVELDDRIEGFGVRRDDAITRERRTLRARFRMVSSATGAVVLDATAGSDAGIDVVTSDYATIAAENTALERLTAVVADQIVARLALFAKRGVTGESPATP